MAFTYTSVTVDRDADMEAFVAAASSADFDAQMALKADLADQAGPIYDVLGDAEYAAFDRAAKIWISNVK